MAAYLLGRMAISDPSKYARYKALTPDIIARYGGRFLTRGGEKLTLEGPADERRIVLVEFADADAAARFYHSADYQHAKSLREGAVDMQLMIVGGFERK